MSNKVKFFAPRFFDVDRHVRPFTYKCKSCDWEGEKTQIKKHIHYDHVELYLQLTGDQK